nr:unnamed protein product [Callosobruchus chinensis]
MNTPPPGGGGEQVQNVGQNNNNNVVVYDLTYEGDNNVSPSNETHNIQTQHWEEEFLDNLAPSHIAHCSQHDEVVPDPQTNRHSSELFEVPFTLEELEWAINKSPSTAPGYDHITYSMLNKLPSNAKIFLLHIFNDIWVGKKCLNSWKNAIVVPILKPGKNPNLSSSYRPISLLSCVFKTFERLVKQRLDWHLRVHHILPVTQFANKQGFGTMDALSTLTTDIQLSFSRNTYLGAVFLDIKGAFDSVDLSILQEKLVKIFVPPSKAATIINLYRGAMLSTPIVPLHVEAGIPPLQFRRQLVARKFILKSQVKKSTLLNKISTLATLDLVNSYWTHKTSPPLCEAFRETPSLRVRLSRLYDDDPTHSFFDFTAQATVIIPTYTDSTIANRCILQNLLNN